MKPDAHIIVAGCVTEKRVPTDGCAVIAANIVEERLVANAGVLVAIGIVEQRLETDAHIPDSGRDLKERIVAHRRVLPRAASKRWATRFEGWRKRKPAERDWQDQKA